MPTTADFRNGLCLVHQKQLYSIVSFQHVKPGKGGAFVRTKLKHLRTGKVLDHTFTAGVKITTARIERPTYQFLYQEGKDIYHFMHSETFEQIALPAVQITGNQWLQEGQQVTMLQHTETGRFLSCELPATVQLPITYTEPGFKGDTATKTMKPATLATGAQLQVPLFCNIGDLLEIDTRTGQYMKRIAQAGA